MKNNRRDFIKKSASVAAAISVAGLAGCTGAGKKEAETRTRRKLYGLSLKVRIHPSYALAEVEQTRSG